LDVLHPDIEHLAVSHHCLPAIEDSGCRYNIQAGCAKSIFENMIS
jgi:hypothetical protein